MTDSLRVNVRFGKKRTTIKAGLWKVKDLKKRGDIPNDYNLGWVNDHAKPGENRLLTLPDDGHFEITEETHFEGYPKDGVNS